MYVWLLMCCLVVETLFVCVVFVMIAVGFSWLVALLGVCFSLFWVLVLNDYYFLVCFILGLFVSDCLVLIVFAI